MPYSWLPSLRSVRGFVRCGAPQMAKRRARQRGAPHKWITPLRSCVASSGRKIKTATMLRGPKPHRAAQRRPALRSGRPRPSRAALRVCGCGVANGHPIPRMLSCIRGCYSCGDDRGRVGPIQPGPIRGILAGPGTIPGQLDLRCERCLRGKFIGGNGRAVRASNTGRTPKISSRR